jgi:hypothetical protein
MVQLSMSREFSITSYRTTRPGCDGFTLRPEMWRPPSRSQNKLGRHDKEWEATPLQSDQRWRTISEANDHAFHIRNRGRDDMARPSLVRGGGHPFFASNDEDLGGHQLYSLIRNMPYLPKSVRTHYISLPSFPQFISFNRTPSIIQSGV